MLRRDSSEHAFTDPGSPVSKFDLMSPDLKVVTEICQYAYHSMRLDKLNTLRPIASPNLVSVRGYTQKMHVTLYDLKWPWAKVSYPNCIKTTTTGQRYDHHDFLGWLVTKLQPCHTKLSLTYVESPLLTRSWERCQEHIVFNKGVKLFKTRALKASLQSAAF